MEFFSALKSIRDESDIPLKLAALQKLHAGLAEGKVVFDHALPADAAPPPSFAKICTIVHGSQVARRRNLGTPEGRVIFVHALAHIEYSAIDLALDSAYRFRQMPPQYYEDWFRVALDEARHFGMLQKLLSALGSHYGALTVHTGIHDAMVASENSLRRRMAATHRHLEANGLDAHPELARKFAAFTDPMAQQIQMALKTIYEDEIGHVAAGDFWFRYACAVDGSSPDVFAEDVVSAIPGSRPGKKQMNREARLRAGFTEAELAALSDENA